MNLDRLFGEGPSEEIPDLGLKEDKWLFGERGRTFQSSKNFTVYSEKGEAWEVLLKRRGSRSKDSSSWATCGPGRGGGGLCQGGGCWRRKEMDSFKV